MLARRECPIPNLNHGRLTESFADPVSLRTASALEAPISDGILSATGAFNTRKFGWKSIVFQSSLATFTGIFKSLTVRYFMTVSNSKDTILRFLHFSDIHFGQPGAKAVLEDVREEVIRDCRKVQESGAIAGPPKAILIAGDIAYAGREAEYQEAGLWIDRVALAVGCGPRDVRLIPGNHDVDWSRLGEAGRALQDKLRQLPADQIGTALTAALSDRDSPLVAKLDDYLSFAAAYGCSFEDPKKPYHEFVYSLGRRNIKVRGLCSVLVSDNTDRPETMVLGTPQYAIPRDDMSELMVMVHHPLGWFKDKQEAGSYLKRRARLVLSGHEHLPELVQQIWEGEFQQLHIAAGAVNPPSVTSIHKFTYNWIELSWQHTGRASELNVRILPRVWNFSEARFDPDYLRTEGNLDRTIKLPCAMAANFSSDHNGSKPELVSTPSDSSLNDEDNISLLRFRFWRYCKREARQRILHQLGLLPMIQDGELHSRVLEARAFEAALKDAAKISQINEALGSMSLKPISSYPRADPNAIEREISRGVEVVKPEEINNDTLQTLSDDFARAGYIRLNQGLTISVRQSKKGTKREAHIVLEFSAEIVPINGTATVFAPGVRAPDHVQLLTYEYRLNRKQLKMYDGESVSERAKDRMKIEYKVLDDAVADIVDDHVWPSPVVNYKVRFKRRSGYRLEVSNIGKFGQEEMIEGTSVGDYVEFIGKPAALMAQRIKWKLIAQR